MKNNWKYVVLVFGVVAGFTSCVQDLNTEPIDKHSATSFNQDAVFSKCYATLATTGQKGPDGDCDIDDLDEGTSSFYRMMWELNEFGTDEGWWIWNDVGLADIRVMNWNGDNALVKGLYYRLNIDIKICNHFLSYTEGATDEKTLQQRAEVRFIRAFNYWYLLDMFKVIPFNTKESSELPEFKERPELYEWLVAELKELTTLLPEQRLSIYRVDRYAAWLLLARTYINAEIYTGTPAWNEALAAAEEALKGPYTLHTNSVMSGDGTIRYSAYQQLFMGDNNRNGAEKEIMLLAYQDGVYCQSWGGSRFVINMVRDAGMVPAGSDDSWKCFRSSPEFVYKFVNQNQAENIKTDEYHMPELLGDDRAIMCSATDSVNADRPASGWELSGNMDADFYKCWSVLKFTGVYSTSSNPNSNVSLSGDPSWPDTDLPWLRVAEAYMIKAEALFRTGKTADALAIINDVIRKRANAAPLAKLDEATLCDEYCREFYCEGHRRSDLIRFNRFAGPKADANSYHWEGRNGQTSSAGFKSAEEKWNWYPIPNDDKATNTNYKNTNGDDY